MLAVLRAALLFVALATASARAEPTTWALIVGVGDTAEPRLGPVKNAPNDAGRVRDHLTTIGRVPTEHVALLTDGGADYFVAPPSGAPAVALPTRRNVRLALKWLAARVGEGDRTLVYWSGQAATIDGAAWLATSDATLDDPASMIDARWLAAELAALPAPGLVLDASFAGRGEATNRGAPAPSPIDLGAPRLALWAAGHGPAIEASGEPHGAFTLALVLALRGGGPPDAVWARLVSALPDAAPSPIRRGDPGALFPRGGGDDPPELVLQTPHAGNIVHAAFDPSGRLLATTGDDGVVKLWSVASHRIIANLDAPGLQAAVVWSPDGARLLVEGTEGVIAYSATGRRLWRVAIDAASWPDRLRVFQLALGPSTRFSPDGALVCVPEGHAPATVRKADDGAVVTTLEPTLGPVAWLPGGLAWAVGGEVHIARGAAWKVVQRLAGGGIVANLVASHDGKALLVGRAPETGGDFPRQEVRLHVGPRWVEMRLEPPLTANLPIVWSDAGGYFVVPRLDGATIIFRDGTRRALDAEAGGLVQLGADGRELALYLADDTRVYDVATGRLTRTIPGEAIAIDRDLTAALSGSSSNWGSELRFKDLTGKVAPVPLEAGARPVEGLGLVGQRLLVVEPAGVTPWDLATGRPTDPSPDDRAAVGSVAGAPTIDGRGTLTVAGRRYETGITGAERAIAIGPERVAILPLVRYSDRACRAMAPPPPPERCIPWDRPPPEATFAPILWDLAAGRRHGTLSGHRGAVTGLVASADGRTIITASLDTTLRVWDAQSGALLATVAQMEPPTAGEALWVVTTPDGLYDASRAAQAMMQWRVGGALIRLEQLGERFTPGLLGRLFLGERPRAASALEDLAPPPRVTIVSPARGTSPGGGIVEVRVEVDDTGGGASAPWLYHNGHRVPATRARPLVGKSKPTTAFTVELAEGDNLLRATAFNRDGSVESDGDALTLTWTVPDAERPVLHLLAVGVDGYDDPSLKLAYAVADAKAIASAFTGGPGQLFARVVPRTLLDRAATRAAILQALGEVAAAAHPRDAVLVYLAGHGTLVGATFYYLPVEAKTATDEDLVRSGLSQADLAEALTKIPATKQIVVLDACHSGAGAKALGRALAERDAVGLARAQRRLAKASGVFLVAAATAEQKAGEIAELGHGLLTYAILSGLGRVDGGGKPAARVNGDGQVTVNALLAWLDEEVPRLTARHRGGPQTPVQASTGQDFPLIVAP